MREALGIAAENVLSASDRFWSVLAHGEKRLVEQSPCRNTDARLERA
jgi:hypothetical protein